MRDDIGYRKSSHSGAEGNCVEVGARDGMIHVRDTKGHGNGPVCRFTADEWRAFIAEARLSLSSR
jgi:hypothetical protein